jgi:UDP-N-acetylmuramyl pentapeptide phosphotransferase/UDP-N-acetylglucosamine-1-phosphate transferase
MDGIDWITAVETVSVTAGLALFGVMGALPRDATIVAFALGGAVIGFMPFNRPVARLFLGDVGSLPIGLLVGWCLMQLAGHQHLIAALLLPLYYLADATLTLARRIAKGEPFWAAHRTHFYQRATDNGFSVPRVVGEVFLLNLVLAGLALASALAGSATVDALAAVAGAAAVALLLRRFSRRRSP